MEEIWKEISTHKDYFISNLGRVKSVKCKKDRILKQILSRQGYLKVAIGSYDFRKSKQIHQLVAIEFLNHVPCGNTIVVNHKDFNKLNNHVDNLEIVTNRENTNKKHLKFSSQYTGVYWYKKLNKWHAQIYINKQKYHLGYFVNEIDAHLAYENKLKQLTNA